MNLLHDQIAELCHGLKLQRLAADWPGIAQRAAAEEAGYAEFLKMGIPMIVTADSGDRDRAVPGPWI